MMPCLFLIDENENRGFDARLEDLYEEFPFSLLVGHFNDLLRPFCRFANRPDVNDRRPTEVRSVKEAVI